MTTTTLDLRRRIIELARHEEPGSYSVMIRTHRTHPENEQDPIRWKNALDTARDRLLESGVKVDQVASMLEPLRRRLDERDFWRHRDLGLAAFGSPTSEPIEMTLPIPLEQQIRVTDRFHFRPLLPALEDVAVPALVLARGGVALYTVDIDGARREGADLPKSVDDANWFVDREPRLQQRTAPPSTPTAGFHGHAPEEDEDEDLRRYLDAIASAVRPLVEGDVPLAIASPDDLAARFERVAGFDVVGIPALEPHASPSVVAEAVAPVRSRFVEERRSRVRSEFRAALGRGDAIDGLADALLAGLDGRIHELALLVDAEPVWGKVDEQTRRVTIRDERQEGDEDLIDRLAVLTLAAGGKIEPLHEPIEDEAFVAIPRY